MSNQQLERLAKYISNKIEGEPSRQNEGIADCAIRLLKEYRERIAELEAQLLKSQRRSRQLYAALEGAKRIASEYYVFGLEGFDGEYTQIVNQLNDGLPEVEE